MKPRPPSELGCCLMRFFQEHIPVSPGVNRIRSTVTGIPRRYCCNLPRNLVSFGLSELYAVHSRQL